MGHLGFSYIGLLWLAMLFIPNLYWVKRQPTGYTSAEESRLLAALERIGEVGVTCCALVFPTLTCAPSPPAASGWPSPSP